MVSELSCDATILFLRTREDRSAYTKILKKYAADHGEITLSNALVHKDENIQERITKLMNSRKMKRWEKVVAVCALVVFVLADSLVAFAYPNEYHVEDTTDAAQALAPVAEGYGLCGHDGICVECDNHVFEILYDAEFIDEAGTIYPVNTTQPLVFCLGHEWKQGYVQTHEKHDDGGCTIKLFNAKRCPVCNSIVIESLYSTRVYATCPH